MELKNDSSIKSDQFINEEKELFNLKNFILQNLIGQGNCGKVYQVKNKKTGEIFAEKISIERIEDITKDSLIDLYHEVNIISKLEHSSVLTFIGFSPNDFNSLKMEHHQILFYNSKQMKILH